MILTDGVLIKPFKNKTYTQRQADVNYNSEKNKDKDPQKDVMEVEYVVNKVSYEIQKATVVDLAPTLNVPYNIGDIVYYYVSRKGVPYRWVKDTHIVKPYDIIGYETV